VAEEITGEERDAVWVDIVIKTPSVGPLQMMMNRAIPLLRLTHQN
jgi:hypothetical protein